MSEAGAYDDYNFIADLYDHVTTYSTRRDVEFFVEEARQSGGPVLEIGCGTGRVLIPTARAGIEIVGLDLSDQMLDRCRVNLTSEGEDVRAKATLLKGDMRSFDLGRKFRLITIPFRPFQHLTTVEDQFSCLASVRNSLAEDGRFILDLFNPKLESLVADNLRQETDENIEFSMPDGRLVRRKSRIAHRDLFNQIVYSELIYYVTHPDDREERLVHAFPMRYLFRFEAEHLLARAGFRVEAVYADYDRKPFGSQYPGELIIVAVK
jgi:SAM-dependent methyltransferase